VSGSTAAGRRRLGQAESALELAQTDPRRAVGLATALIQNTSSDPEVRAVALRAAGLALAELHRPAEALRQLDQAVRLAGRSGLDQREGEARMSAAWVLFTMGRGRQALVEADRAGALLRDHAAHRMRAQRAVILHGIGRTEEAFADYDAALVELVRGRDRLWEALARNNRGILYAERNQIQPATRDLVRAGELFRELGMALAVAHIEHNLGFLAARAGDTVAALDWFRRSEEGHLAAGVPPTLVLISRAEVLLGVRLADEAVSVARRAVGQSQAARRSADLAQARLVLAEASLVAGDADEARRSADEALRAFRRQGRTAWALLAQWVGLRARLAAAERPDGRLLGQCRRLGARLRAAHWDNAALEAGIEAARLAVGLGRPAVAMAELDRAAPTGRRVAALTRARGLYAVALRRYLAGDRRGARAALRRGTATVSDYATALGSLDLRAGVASHVADLTELGVRIALDGGRAASVLHWSELGRGLTLRTRPAPPPDDAELAALLAELRHVAVERRTAALAGVDPRPLVRRQARLEEAVRMISRRSRSRAATAPTGPTDRLVERLADLLADRTLVSYVEGAGEVVAVVCSGGRVGMRNLGPIDRLGNEVGTLLAALRRLSGGYGSDAVLRQRRTVAEQAAARLEATLITPLGLEPNGRPVVIVPAGVLHSLPWPALPALAGRAVTVAPSAALWAGIEGRRRARERRGRRPLVLVQGPDLPGAQREVAELAAAAPATTTLRGADATVAAVLDAVSGADVAHIACHGEFRPDNPLFSTLRLADGPLTVYDLQRVRRVPRRMVLSACDVGRTAVTAGEGLLGMSAAILSMGAHTLVAPLVSVPDDTTCQLMVGFHERLAAGTPADAALLQARETLPDDAAGYATRASFLCLGHG
jgi:CHAT domain